MKGEKDIEEGKDVDMCLVTLEGERQTALSDQTRWLSASAPRPLRRLNYTWQVKMDFGFVK